MTWKCILVLKIATFFLATIIFENSLDFFFLSFSLPSAVFLLTMGICELRLNWDSSVLFSLTFLLPNPASLPFSQELKGAVRKVNVLKHTNRRQGIF